jgi:multimeric flavodoxin WrbA
VAELAARADGLVIGTPVYFRRGQRRAVRALDRMFVSAGPKLRYKPAAAVVSCRRSGASAAFRPDQQYFTIMQMPVVSSQYWKQRAWHRARAPVKKDLRGAAESCARSAKTWRGS